MIAIATNLIVRPSTVTTTTNSRINSVTKDSHVPFSFSHRSLIPMQQDLDSKFISNDKPPNFTAENNMSSYYNENFNFVQQSTNWSERILQDIIGLLHILSPSGKVLYCSESCLELTGYSPHELIGKSLTDFIHVDDLDIFSRNLQLAFTSLSRIKVHYRIRRKDNTYLLLESIGHPKQDVPDQPPQSFFAIAQPYLSRSNGLLDSFLELKMENEWLKKRLNDLLPYQQQQQQQHQQQIEQQQQQQQQIEQQQIEQQQQHKQQQQQQQKKQQHQQHHQQRQHIQQQHQQHQHQHQHQQQQQYQQQQLQQHHQPIQLQYYPQPFFTNDLLLGTNEPYFINTSPQTSSRRPSSCSSTMFQTNNPISMADDSINNHCNTETKYSPSIGSVEFNEMLIRYNQEEDPTSGGMATTSSYLSSNNSATTSVTDILRKDKWKRRKKHRGMDDYVCADCGTTASPEWRKGPHGPKTLCNACGLRWAKKNKKI